MPRFHPRAVPAAALLLAAAMPIGAQEAQAPAIPADDA